MNLGIFDSNKFSLQELTAAINEAPALPSRIGSLGLFAEEGILTTNLTVEKNVDTLALIANQSRSGTPTGTGTILNDDTQVSVAVAPTPVGEGSGTGMVYTFSRTGTTTAALPIRRILKR